MSSLELIELGAGSCEHNEALMMVEQTVTVNGKKESAYRSRNLLSHIASLYTDAKTSDVVLSVTGGGVFPAHRIVLSQSPVFCSMLYGESWQESSAKEVHLSEVEEYTYAFEDFLKFMYGKELQICWQNVEALVYFGDKYAVDTLLTECLDFFYHHVEVDGDLLSALSGWKIIRRILSQRQNSDCLNLLKSVLLSNIELIMKDESIIETMDEDDVVAFISSDEVVCRSEFSLFKLVEHWLNVKTTGPCRMTKLLKFTPYLRLPFMHVQEMSYVENSPGRLFPDQLSDDYKTATSVIKSLLCDAYKYHVIGQAERVHLMRLPNLRLYLDGAACMKYRLLNTDGLSSWSKMESNFKVKNSMSTADSESREWSFCVTLMRKMNVRHQLNGAAAERLRASILSLEISQNFCGPVPFKGGVVYIYERRAGAVLRRPLARFDISATRMKSDMKLEGINFEDVIAKNSLYQYADEQGGLIFLALDIFLHE